MSLQRIATSADLGAVIRESRLAARLTQAELAAKAGVSREWLIGLERGARPRAELTKVLSVLDVLDLPLAVGRASSASGDGAEREQPEGAGSLSTAEVTRRAIDASRASATGGSVLRSPALQAILAGLDVTGPLPKVDVSALLPKADVAKMLPRTDFAALMPAIEPSVLTALAHGAMPSAGALLRASQAMSAAGEGVSSEDGADGRRDDSTPGPHGDIDSPTEAGH